MPKPKATKNSHNLFSEETRTLLECGFLVIFATLTHYSSLPLDIPAGQRVRVPHRPRTVCEQDQPDNMLTLKNIPSLTANLAAQGVDVGVLARALGEYSKEMAVYIGEQSHYDDPHTWLEVVDVAERVDNFLGLLISHQAPTIIGLLPQQAGDDGTGTGRPA